MGELLSFGSGGLVGFALGLLGGGGSILAVPLLVYVVGVKDPHVAIGTSALAVSVNAFANLISHARAGTVKWPCAIVFALAGIAGAALGAFLRASREMLEQGTFTFGEDAVSYADIARLLK